VHTYWDITKEKLLDTYVAPEFNKRAFNCPSCGAYAGQFWKHFYPDEFDPGVPDMSFSICAYCDNASVWYKEHIVYPQGRIGPLPNPDLPNHIKEDYEEARSIVSLSPRGAVALLRLVVQKLCKHLGESGKDINADIASLVQKGLDPRIQKAFDVVRVIGNNAVHPGQIDLKDNPAIAEQLLELINVIAERMITHPKHLDGLFDSLPDNQKEAITKRDAQKTNLTEN